MPISFPIWLRSKRNFTIWCGLLPASGLVVANGAEDSLRNGFWPGVLDPGDLVQRPGRLPDRRRRQRLGIPVR